MPKARQRLALLTLAAILLRLLLFFGRGDYVALDEGWYLLLGRSLMHGDGYSLIGIPHLTLSPLFPMLAGAVGSVLGDWVWGGRVVAALASGLLVVPVYAIARVALPAAWALTAAAFVAVAPALAPFVAAYWVGADLWVGAEPLLHLGVYAGLAAWLAGEARGRTGWYAVAGLAFGLGFLARPEAILPWGMLGLITLGLAAVRRSNTLLARAALMGLCFVLVATPYWSYLHRVQGRWALSGRAVSVRNALPPTGSDGQPASANASIERMLYQGDSAYVANLYAVDAAGTRMRSDYWGVYPGAAEQAADAAAAPAPSLEPSLTEPSPTPPATAARAADPPREPPSRLVQYAQALHTLLPWYWWPLLLLGLTQLGRGGLWAPVVAMGGSSVAIALIVAVDARTQAVVVPMALVLVAAGIARLRDAVAARSALREAVQPARVAAGLSGLMLLVSLGTQLWRLGASLAYGSPHHVVGTQNRAVAQALDTLPGLTLGPVSSFHPAIAVFADRDWRPLAHTNLGGMLRYAGAAGASTVVVSAYYPPTRGRETLGARYAVLAVPPDAATASNWTLTITGGDSLLVSAVLSPPR